MKRNYQKPFATLIRMQPSYPLADSGQNATTVEVTISGYGEEDNGDYGFTQ